MLFQYLRYYWLYIDSGYVDTFVLSRQYSNNENLWLFFSGSQEFAQDLSALNRYKVNEVDVKKMAAPSAPTQPYKCLCYVIMAVR